MKPEGRIEAPNVSIASIKPTPVARKSWYTHAFSPGFTLPLNSQSVVHLAAFVATIAIATAISAFPEAFETAFAGFFAEKAAAGEQEAISIEIKCHNRQHRTNGCRNGFAP